MRKKEHGGGHVLQCGWQSHFFLNSQNEKVVLGGKNEMKWNCPTHLMGATLGGKKGPSWCCTGGNVKWGVSATACLWSTREWIKVCEKGGRLDKKLDSARMPEDKYSHPAFFLFFFSRIHFILVARWSWMKVSFFFTLITIHFQGDNQKPINNWINACY